MKFSKRIIIFAAIAIVGGMGSYAMGVSGVDPATAITEGRCSSGAFIAHADPPKDLQADAHANTAAAPAVTEQDKATAISTPVATTGPNLMPNPGVETLAGDVPVNWASARTGNNNATFSQVAGHNSTRALRVDITKYSGGSADWYTPLVTVQPGSYYVYSDYYRSNVDSNGVLMLQNDQGKQTFITLAGAPASLGWSAYSARFFIPTNVHQIQVSHVLDKLGSLETDDFSLAQATATGFSEPLISLTFDDGWASIHDAALPIMQRYHVVSTQYLVSGYLGMKGYVKPGQVYDFVNSGDEIASHSFDHKDLTTLGNKDLARELTLPAQGLSACYGGTVSDFAAPYGTYNVHTTTQTKATYQTGRSTDPGFNSPDQFNPFELKVETVAADTTPEQLQGWIDTAKTNHLWLILVYHQIDTSSHGAYARTPAKFEADIQKIVASGVPVKTVHQAYTEIAPQLKH